MEEIAPHIYIETAYPGVTLGAISLAHGMVMVDAPLRPEDGRAWRLALQNLGSGGERLLVSLDAQYDRTLGARALEAMVVSHEKTAQVFRNRPTTFKAQTAETGAEWELISGLGSIRWAPPDITFSHRMHIFWDETGVVLEHHPGPSAGAIWVRHPVEKVLFLGDAVTPNQPPFLSNADLPSWIETLQPLTRAEYRDYLLISGRDRLVTIEQVRKQIAYLKEIQHRLVKLAEKKAGPEEIEAAVPALLAASGMPAPNRDQYALRLRWGLTHYLARRHKPVLAEEE